LDCPPQAQRLEACVLPATSVHFEVGVSPQLFDRDKRRPVVYSEPFLGSPVNSRLPGLNDLVPDRVRGVPLTHKSPQVNASPGVKAEVPLAIRRQPTAVT